MTTSTASLLSAANAAWSAGDPKKARRLYRDALRIDSGNPQILLELAVREGQIGQLNEARKLLLKAVNLAPDDADIHYNLGQAERALERPAAAAERFLKTHTLAPDYPGIHYAIGEALLVADGPDAARAWLVTALQQAPDDNEVKLAHALSMEPVVTRSEGLTLFARIDPKSSAGPIAQYNIARLYALKGETAKALVHLKRARAAMKIPPHFLAVAAEIYLAGGNIELAGQLAKAATRHNKADALSVLGQIEVVRGNFTEAEKLFRKALTVSRNRAQILNRLSKITPLGIEFADELGEILEDRTAPVNSRTTAGLTLYSVHAGEGRDDAAFDSLKTANEAAKEEFRFNPEQHEARCEAVMAAFTRDTVNSPPTSRQSGRYPIFIVGMPRSGTTLIERVVSANSRTAACGETNFVPMASHSISGFPHGVVDTNETERTRLASQLLDRLFAKADGFDHVTDKLPSNYAHLGFIKWLIPHAKFIYCRRQPQAVALSLYEQFFGGQLSYSYDLEAIARVYNMHTRLMKHWRDACGIEYMTVDYEKLVGEPERVGKSIYDHLSLPWDPAYLTDTRGQEVVLTASAWQARQPINTGSIERWRRYEEQLRPFTEALETE